MLTCSELAADEGKVVLHQLGCISCKAKPDEMTGLDSYHQDTFSENLGVGGGFGPSLSHWSGHGTPTDLKLTEYVQSGCVCPGRQSCGDVLGQGLLWRAK